MPSNRTFEEELLAARAAVPPEEPGNFLPHDFVELSEMEPAIRLDLRYATAENFLAVPIYPEPRAFLQRPVAVSLAAAHRRLRTRGYGLVVLDAYRPWYVTKLFWEMTPHEQRGYVANPAIGSGHNRGTAVDVTLWDTQTGRLVDMPSDFDEFAERARSEYQGGPLRPRQMRDLLRADMETEGFTVHSAEWWHFDHGMAGKYSICNQSFEELASLRHPPSVVNR